MPLSKQNERGSVMIEVLAILALLGVMAPMLVRQIALRSQEVDNVNMASEIRTIAEGVDAYLQADRSVLEASCPVSNNRVVDCSRIMDYGTLCMFLPNGFCGENADDNGVLDYYEISLSGYLLDEDIAPRPVYQAIVVPSAELLPKDFTLKQASRVAAMTGVMGGIVQRSDQSTAHGTAGAWELNLNSAGYAGAKAAVSGVFNGETSIKAIYVALVTMSSFTPEVYTDTGDGNAVAAPISMGFRDMHAWNYFSVGQVSPGASGACIEQLSRETDPDSGAVQSDVIYGAGNNNCDPLFWVGAAKGGSDKSQQGHVYARNNLYIGRDNTNGISAIALEAGEETTTARSGLNHARRMVVYDTDGKSRVEIDATGRVVLKTRVDADGNVIDKDSEGTKESEGIVLQHVDGTETVTKEMVIKAGEIRNTQDTLSDEVVPDIAALTEGDVDKDKQYRINLTGEGSSLLHDIRLGARKGAKLSDLLPNYIAKAVYSINSDSVARNPYEVKVTKPTCPQGYKPAIIVTPTRWDSGRVVRINAGHSHLLDQGDIANIADRLVANGNDVSAVSGTYTANVGNNMVNSHVIGNQQDSYANANSNISRVAIRDDTGNIVTRRARFAVTIDNKANDFSDAKDASNTTISADEPSSSKNATGHWIVRLGYKVDGEALSSWSQNEPVYDSISALAQTYCVYVD